MDINVYALNKQLDENAHIHSIDFNPYPAQKDFLNSRANYLMLIGANRTGKTYTGAHYGKFHLTGNYPHWYSGHTFSNPIRMLCMGKSFSQVEGVLIPAYLGSATTKGALHHSQIESYVKSPVPRALIKHISGGFSELMFLTDRIDWTRMQGHNFHVVHFDEENNPKVTSEVIARTVAVDGEKEPGKNRMVYWTMCPLLGKTELVKRFLTNTEENQTKNGYFYRTLTFDDSKHIPEDERKRFEDSIPDSEKAARIYGRPEVGHGLVYPVSLSQIVCKPFEIPGTWKKIIGLDFGWRATAAIVITYDEKSGIYYITDEYKLGNLTPTQHVNNFIKRGWHNYKFYYDPAGHQSKQDNGEKMADLFKSAGLRYMEPANNSLTGTNKVLELYQSQQLKIFANNPMLIEEMEGYIRDETGKIVQSEDHLLDAKRYAITTGLDELISKRTDGSWYNRQKPYFGS